VPDALFQSSRLRIVGDAFEVVPQLIEKIKSIQKRNSRNSIIDKAALKYR
jgi:uncharacterized spore protein YtfJ